MLGGNIQATIEVLAESYKNVIGESEQIFTEVKNITGWLDMVSGDSGRLNFYAKVEESTHVFLCDYFTIDFTAENARLVIDGKVYDIRYIDNPMQSNQHLEIYLKYMG